MLEAREMWCWKETQKISWTERRTKEDVLKLVEEEKTLIDTIKRRKWLMNRTRIGHEKQFDN